MNPPKEVKLATILLILATILNLTTSALNKFGLEKITWQALTIIPFLLLNLFIIYKIYQGKRWARNLYLVLFAISLFDYTIQLIPNLLTNPLTATISLASQILQITALAYLFKNTTTKYYITKKSPTTKKHTTKIITILSVLFFLLTIYILTHIINPQQLIEKIGITNGYIIALIVSFFGGFSSATAVTFYSIFAALITTGLNPLALGIIGGISLATGDILIFHFGNQTRKIATSKIDQEIKYIANKIEKHNLQKFIPITAFLYLAATPLPNDWLLLFLAAIQYPAKTTRRIIILGDITLCTLYTILVSYGITLF